MLSPPSDTSSYSDPSFELPSQFDSSYLGAKYPSNASNILNGFSDDDLYNHYLHHTSLALSLCESDYSALHVGMAKLALESETVFHSLLAVSAASLAWNMIFKEPDPDAKTVNQVLLVGYQHYNFASEQMRGLISRPGSWKPEPLIASALLLVPFATASQQINHWVSRRSNKQEPHKLLTSTPRDVIIIMTGIRTILQTLDSGTRSTNIDSFPEAEYESRKPSVSWGPNSRSIAPPSSRTHVMGTMIATTSQRALSKLQERLDSVFLDHSRHSDESLSACSVAFKVLQQIRNRAFQTISSSPPYSTKPEYEPESTPSSQIAPWLQSFARRLFASTATISQPNQPLTRLLFSFLNQAPQEYLEIVLPLLDQRLENLDGSFPDRSAPELTRTQALALDIYAHWSVLMFLVEDESWWIGTLPTVTLTGLLNRYGEEFISQWWPDNKPGKPHWWPASMLNIFQDVKRYR